MREVHALDDILKMVSCFHPEHELIKEMPYSHLVFLILGFTHPINQYNTSLQAREFPTVDSVEPNAVFVLPSSLNRFTVNLSAYIKYRLLVHVRLSATGVWHDQMTIAKGGLVS